MSALGTSSYCDARKRLPIELPVVLGSMVGERLESMAPSHWRWQKRPVKLFDGTTITMPDTPSNQQTYLQSSEQKPGLGFPIARIGALIGLTSGAIGLSGGRMQRQGDGGNKACWQTCWIILMTAMCCWPMRCWRLGGSFMAQLAGEPNFYSF